MKEAQRIMVRPTPRKVIGMLGMKAIFCTGLALTSVGAHADSGSQVQLYGLIGTYVGSVKRSDTPQSTVLMGSGGLTTSFWGIGGKEVSSKGWPEIPCLELSRKKWRN